MVPALLLCFQNPFAALPTDVDPLKDALVSGETAYLLRAPIHLGSSVSHAAFESGFLVFSRNEPSISADNLNPRRSGVYRWSEGSEQAVPLIEFSGRSIAYGGVVGPHVVGFSRQILKDAKGNAVAKWSVLRLNVLERRGDSLDLPVMTRPSEVIQAEGAVGHPNFSVRTEIEPERESARHFAARLDGGGWVADSAEPFRFGLDGSLLRVLPSNELEGFDPANRMWKPSRQSEAAKRWSFSSEEPGLSTWLTNFEEPAPADQPEETRPILILSTESVQSGARPNIVNRRETWLATTDPDGPNRIPLSYSADKVKIDGVRAVAYLERGHLFVRPIKAVPRKLFVDWASAVESAELMTRGKHVGLGIAIYMADHDDKFPPKTDFRTEVTPYLRNVSDLDGFEYLPPDGKLTANDVEDPSKTVMGRVRGRFGTAIIMVDGSVRWERP